MVESKIRAQAADAMEAEGRQEGQEENEDGQVSGSRDFRQLQRIRAGGEVTHNFMINVCS